MPFEIVKDPPEYRKVLGNSYYQKIMKTNKKEKNPLDDRKMILEVTEVGKNPLSKQKIPI